MTSTLSATVVHPAWVDDRGTDVPDWDHATSVVEAGWRFVPLSAVELRESGRQGGMTMLRGFGPHDSEIGLADRVVISGETWEIDGEPAHWPSITGGLAHVEITIKRVTG